MRQMSFLHQNASLGHFCTNVTEKRCGQVILLALNRVITLCCPYCTQCTVQCTQYLKVQKWLNSKKEGCTFFPWEYRMIYRGPRLGRMIWLPPSPVRKLRRRHTGRLRKRYNLRTEKGGGEVGEKPNEIIRRRESLVLSNSFITLCFSLPMTKCLFLLENYTKLRAPFL